MSRHIDLSHTIEDGMITYKGLPAPVICDYWTFDSSTDRYAPGTEFEIRSIDMVANTSTYLDTPRHRFRHGHDLSALPLEKVSNVPGRVIRIQPDQRAIGPDAFAGVDIKGNAIVIHTGWDRYWRTETYFENHPFLTEAAAIRLRDEGAVIVGIDSYNIDDVSGGERPVHTTLLGADIPIVEHMSNLAALPDKGFRFYAIPPKIKDMGTFPVRAHAIID